MKKNISVTVDEALVERIAEGKRESTSNAVATYIERYLDYFTSDDYNAEMRATWHNTYLPMQQAIKMVFAEVRRTMRGSMTLGQIGKLQDVACTVDFAALEQCGVDRGKVIQALEKIDLVGRVWLDEYLCRSDES